MTQDSVSEPLDAQALARHLGVSQAAAELTLASDLIDLHLDTFIPPRLPLLRYDLFERHPRGLFGGRFFGHLDVPRLRDSGLSGAMWSITTNPFRRASRRWTVFQKNLTRFRQFIDATQGQLRLVRTTADYHAARAAGAHAVFLAVQGGNAFQCAPDGLASLPDPDRSAHRYSLLTRVTLVHLTNACYGITSSPFRMFKGKRGLTDSGRAFISDLNAHRVWVDLAHINAAGFWDAVAAHDPSLPLIATHTGVSGVTPHWRNLDDRQLRAIAATGGVVGIIFAKNFLKVRGMADNAQLVVAHMEHAIQVAGEGAVAIGSDFDGAIIPPRDLRSGETYARLVAAMLDRGWREERILNVLGRNFLRSFELLRPDPG